MSKTDNDAQRAMYAENADAYEELIRSEDADGLLRAEVLARVPVDGLHVLDVGAGTGRVARWFVGAAASLTLVEREPAMLELAKGHLGEAATYHVGDARALPVPDKRFDVAIAGWVFGHFRHWMPEGWRLEVDAAVKEMQRVAVPGGTLAIIETLGTGHETPRAHEALDEYFAHLENQHGFVRTWARSDYVFESSEQAAEVMGPFFGEALVAKIRANDWARVPECTALFVRRV